MKRVLILSYIFPPMVAGGAPRMAQFARYLPEFGWRPTVLTVPADESGGIDRQTLDELPPEVRIERARCPLLRSAARGRPNPRRGVRGLLRTLKRKLAQFCFIPDWQILWYPYAVAAGRRLLSEERYDAVMATYGPATNMLIAARLARSAGLPLVLDFRDLWVDNPVPRWITPLHRRVCRRIERSVVQQASKITAAAPAMAQHLALAHHRLPCDVASITNGFDPADAARAVDRRKLDDPQRPLRIAFTGSVYGPTDFTALLLAIGDLAVEQKLTPAMLQLEFVGNMTMQEPEHYGVSDFVSVRPHVPHREVFEVLAECDVALMIEPPGYCVKYSYAAKLFDYMLTGKPILALIEDGENSAALLRELGRGVVVHPQDRAGIRAALLELTAARQRPADPVDVQSDPYCRFDRRRLTGQLARVLDEASRHQENTTGGSRGDPAVTVTSQSP